MFQQVEQVLSSGPRAYYLLAFRVDLTQPNPLFDNRNVLTLRRLDPPDWPTQSKNIMVVCYNAGELKAGLWTLG